jgi:integrase/recombinase XerD
VDVGAALELPRRPQHLPRSVLAVSEVEQVLAQPDLTDPMGLRDRAILETFYSTGMRRMELITLALRDVDSGRGVVMIREGKGKKDRVVPIGERALDWIERYVAEVRPRCVVEPDPGNVFLARRGRPLRSNRLTELVHRYVSAAGLGKTGSCHVFRHTMATLMLEHGADVRYIQPMLGHAQLTTTELYTRVSITQLKAVHQRTHPAHRTRAERAAAEPPPLP